jgi:hypothetical protein
MTTLQRKSSGPIGVTFIPASVYDNPPLLEVDPEYVARLESLPLIEREWLLCGREPALSGADQQQSVIVEPHAIATPETSPAVSICPAR